jgi:hypothetical protein
VLSATQREQNEKHKQALVAFIQQHRPALVVGSGCSISCGYPSWPTLLTELERDAKSMGNGYDIAPGPTVDPLERAQCLKDHYRQHGHLDRYHSFLAKNFGPDGHERCSDVHRTLLALPIRGVITPNYDCAIEAALEEKGAIGVHTSVDIDEEARGVVQAFNDSLVAANGVIRVAHIHGSWRRIGQIVLASEDYARAYEPTSAGTERREKIVPSFLGSIFTTFRVLFAGFGLTDEYFMRIISGVAAEHWSQGQSRHFAIVGVASNEADRLDEWKDRMLTEYGITLVAYENADGTHGLLRPLLDELSRACGARPSSILDRATMKAIDGMNP